MSGNGSGPRRPNICFILTDQERHRGWLPDDVDLPARRRLLEGGMEFDELPANVDDDLHTKPDVHRRFIHEMAGVDVSEADLPGRSLAPLLAGPVAEGRSEILLAQDWAWFDRLLATEAKAFADEPGSRPAGAPPWAEG